MLGLLLLLLAVPIVELYVLVQVAGSFGVIETIFLLIGMSIAGAWLAKLAGLGVVNRLQQTVRAGKVPSAELVDGVLVVAAGVLMVVPGFVSDAVALLLILPPTRVPIRHLVLRRIRAGGGFVGVVGGARSPRSPEVWDVESWEGPDDPFDPRRLGR